MQRNEYLEYIGNLHIHTSYSDGGGSVEDIVKAARGAGLDFIVLHDHSYLTRLHLEDEGYHKGLLVLVGSEIGYRFHHYLAFNIKKQIDDKDLSPQEVIDHVNRQGGFGFIAHPFEKGMPFLDNRKAYTWNDWSVKGYTGICIWNFTSRWKENVKTLWHGIFHLLFKKYTLKGPSKKTLSTWDNLCLKRKVVAIGGSDAHASSVKVGFLRIKPFTYKYLLGTINTHILTPRPLVGNKETDRATVYNSLIRGSCFVAHDDLYPAKGFRFFFQMDKGKKIIEMGSEKICFPGIIVIRSPAYCLMKIIKDGDVFNQGYGNKLATRIYEKGVYRAELCRKTPLFGWRPWIFSNPIYIR
jgi:hypothetical protein